MGAVGVQCGCSRGCSRGAVGVRCKAQLGQVDGQDSLQRGHYLLTYQLPTPLTLTSLLHLRGHHLLHLRGHHLLHLRGHHLLHLRGHHLLHLRGHYLLHLPGYYLLHLPGYSRTMLLRKKRSAEVCRPPR